ncbi:MAG: pitrilysin family protein [Alphaproteobacteria bacterium]
MHLFRKSGLIAALCCLVLVAVGSPAGAAVFNPQSFTLANGMQVVVVTNRRAPVVAHMVWYRVGAADEPAGQSGIAHFLEHLMFKGTDTVSPGEFSRIVARNGGTDNAFTSQDYTAYFQKVARDRLELVMRIEADRMRNLTLTDAEVLPERDVVLEERRSRTDNDPGSQLYEAARATLFLNHPYGIPIIGWKHEIENLSTDDALAFYRRYYAPNNAILIVAGDVSLAELRPLAEKYYGVLKPGPAIVRKRIREPPHLAPRRVEMTSPRVGQPSWSRTYLAPSYRGSVGNEAYALQVLARLLGGGATSRLYRALVVEQGIAASAGAWYSPDHLDYGTFGLSVSPRPGKKLAAASDALLAAIAHLLKDGVTDKEVASAKKRMSASAIYARDSLSAAPNIIGRALTTGRRIEDVESWPERIRAVTRAEVEAAARKVLVEAASVTSVLRPAPRAKE